MIHVELYAGKDFPVQFEMGQAHGVVMDLLQKANLLNKGYHLFTDHFYTKPVLAQGLCTAGTLLTGTVRGNSRGIPVIPSLAVGECYDYRREDMLFWAFREKKSQRKPVLMLSTNAAAGVSDSRTAAGLMKRQPNCIIDYNKYMGGVDLSDRKIYHVSAERPTRRYWKKIFFNLLDMALLNSYELYRANTDAGQCKNRHDFLCAVVESLCGMEKPRLAMPAARAPAQAALQIEDHELQHGRLRAMRSSIFRAGKSAIVSSAPTVPGASTNGAHTTALVVDQECTSFASLA